MTFNLNEGGIYHFDKISVSSENELINVQKILETINVSALDKFSLSELEQSKQNILDYLNKNSYAFVDVDYKISLNHKLLMSV